MLGQWSTREEGQGLVEYALILVLVAIVVIAILLQLGPAISDAFCKVTNVLQAGACDDGAISVISGPNPTLVAPNTYDVTVTVQVAEKANVTFTIGSASETYTDCNTTCSITVRTSSDSGNYTVSAGSLGSKSGSY